MSLFSLLSVSASGMAAQRERAALLVENLANAETTRTPEGGPYRRKDAVFSSEAADEPFASVFQTEVGATGTGVKISDVIEDTRPPEQRYCRPSGCPTLTDTCRFRGSTPPRIWWTCWERRAATRPMWPPCRR